VILGVAESFRQVASTEKSLSRIIIFDGEGILGAHVVVEPESKAANMEKGAEPDPEPGGR